ncbi:MAG: hypothetical protein ACFFCW_24445, partial [Candidatus Hodarchaeota archaeon]
ASALVGTISIASGFFGYMRNPLNIPLRALYILSGILLLYPNHGASIIGLVVAILAWFFESPFAKRMRGI